MMRYKDTCILLNDVISDYSKEKIGRKGNLAIVENWVNKNKLIVTDTETKQTFKIDFKDININYSDASKLLLTDLIANKGYNENEFLKTI